MARVRKQTAQRKTGRAPRKAEGLLSQVVPFESRGEIKISIYGGSATGKTTLWSTFPKPILAILCSGGKGTNELDSVSEKDRKQIEPFYLNNCDDLLTLSSELEGDTHYQTVVIDHLSGIQDLRIAEILGLEEIPVQMSRPASKGESWAIATLKQYGERSISMKTYLRRFLDLVDKRVVFVSQEMTVEPGDENDLDILPTIGPYLSGSVLEWFNPACNYICRTFIKPRTKKVTNTIAGEKVVKEKVIKGKFDYCLMTGPSDIYTTKFRLPKEYRKPSFIVDPTYEKITKIISGG